VSTPGEWTRVLDEPKWTRSSLDSGTMTRMCSPDRKAPSRRVDCTLTRNLQRIVNNARFLILPWVQSKGLASKILSLTARQLPRDWLQRYGYRPVLLETFVESPRHLGTCYKAANWQCVGRTTGRGKKSTSSRPTLPKKDIWLYPLQRDFAAVLTR
jgi:hypothetical protein